MTWVARMPEPPRPNGCTDDAFLGGALRLFQPEDGPRAGTDAVLLAASVGHDPAKPGRILEAGCGAGTVALCLAHRLPLVHVTGVERDDDLCALARENVRRNGLSDRVVVHQGDVSGPFSDLQARSVRREGYDHVLANPPFFSDGSARAPAEAKKSRAHVMAAGDLEKWVRFLATCAAPRGRLWMIHRPDALTELLSAMRGRFGGAGVFPLFPRSGAPAARILVSATKGSRAETRLLPGMVVHESTGAYTPAIEAVLREGRALTTD